MTLDEMQAAVAEEIKAPGTNYTAANNLRDLDYNVGCLNKAGRKIVNAKKGIGKHDPERGRHHMKKRAGQALWNLIAWCQNQEEPISLAEAYVYAGQCVQEKQGK